MGGKSKILAHASLRKAGIYLGRWDRNRTCNLRFWSSLLALFRRVSVVIKPHYSRMFSALLYADVRRYRSPLLHGLLHDRAEM
jgi:hypothetical protein